MIRSIHFAFLISVTVATAIAGLPEPDVVFYGRVTLSPASTGYVPATVTWTMNGNAEMLTVSQTQIVVVNTETFYISRIPFETRKLADNTPLPSTPNTLSLPAAATPYTRSATVDGRLAILPAGTGSFNYEAATQGLIERLDLVIGETYNEWSQRIFGTASIDPNADPDHDAATNMEEYLAGTDPLSNKSVFKFITIQPEQPNGIILQWGSVAPHKYTIERSSNVQTGFSILQSNIVATGATNYFRDVSATNTGPYFYLIRTDQ